MSAVVDQRFAALERANSVRFENARLKARIGARSRLEGCEMVAELLWDPPEHLGGLSIGALLRSITRVGETKVLALSTAVGIRSVDRRVRDLTVRQREQLAVMLRGVR